MQVARAAVTARKAVLGKRLFAFNFGDSQAQVSIRNLAGDVFAARCEARSL
jgi:hypothetical protein